MRRRFQQRAPDPAAPAPRRPSDPARSARDRLLKLLATRELSVARARDRLKRWNVPADIAAPLLASLQESGLLDDRRAAQCMVRAALLRKPAGRALLIAKLRAFGIHPALAAEVVADALAPRDPRHDARRLCASTLRRARPGTAPDRLRQRLLAMLVRRGFDFTLARDIVGELTAGLGVTNGH
jgi:regulatory protein